MVQATPSLAEVKPAARSLALTLTHRKSGAGYVSVKSSRRCSRLKLSTFVILNVVDILQRISFRSNCTNIEIWSHLTP